MELRQILKSFDFAGVFSRLIRKLRPKTDFFSQELVPLQCGKYILNVPSGHILNSLKKCSHIATYV